MPLLLLWTTNHKHIDFENKRHMASTTNLNHLVASMIICVLKDRKPCRITCHVTYTSCAFLYPLWFTRSTCKYHHPFVYVYYVPPFTPLPPPSPLHPTPFLFFHLMILNWVKHITRKESENRWGDISFMINGRLNWWRMIYVFAPGCT